MGDSNMSLQIFATIFDSSSSVDSDSSEEEDLQFLQFSWELENVFRCIEPECHPVHIGYMQTVATYSDREFWRHFRVTRSTFQILMSFCW